VAVLTRGCALALVACVVAARSVLLSAGPLTEPQVKASLLFNLAAFVEWPTTALGDGDRLMICVAGDPDVLAALQPFAGKAIDGHLMASRAVGIQDDPSACHILFVSGAREQALTLVHRTADQPVLTVGDGAHFVRQGGTVRVFFEQSRLRFEINATNAARARLKISSRMLGLARVVTDHEL
jgi:hypothetical protein